MRDEMERQRNPSRQLPRGAVTFSSELAEMQKNNLSNRGKKSKLAKMLAKIRNPTDDDMSRAKKVSKEWHGRDAKEILDVEEVYRYSDTGVVLADLEVLGVLNVNSSCWEITFSTNRPKLVADLEKSNLEFVGGDQKLEWKASYTTNKREIPLGYCYQIVYETDKHHLEDSNGYPESYEHFFGEEFYKEEGYDVGDYKSGDDFFAAVLSDGVVNKAIKKGYLPTLVYDCENEKITIAGGRYRITELGIAN